MTLADASAVRAAIREPARCVVDETCARKAYLAFEHALGAASAALGRAGVEALLVKGAALARTVYPQPWWREMSDIDLVALPGQRGSVVAALEGAGFERYDNPRRPWTAPSFGEELLTIGIAGAHFVVEVHDTLDKLVERTIPLAEVRARARALDAFPALFVPAPDDHVLLVVQHLAASCYAHPVAFLDLDLLFRQGLDGATIEARACRWHLQTPTYVALSVLRSLGSTSVPASLIEALRPPRWRRLMVRAFYELDAYPVARATFSLGWPWIAAQTVLRDDFGRWGRGLARYAVLRAGERASAALRARRA
jgi:hypothetical protein